MHFMLHYVYNEVENHRVTSSAELNDIARLGSLYRNHDLRLKLIGTEGTHERWTELVEFVSALCLTGRPRDEFRARVQANITAAGRSLTTETTDKAVLVGTIRDSKGGSAQRVFIYHPDSIKSAGKAMIPANCSLLVRRLLFVAITRSKRDLFLVYEKELPKPVSEKTAVVPKNLPPQRPAEGNTGTPTYIAHGTVVWPILTLQVPTADNHVLGVIAQEFQEARERWIAPPPAQPPILPPPAQPSAPKKHKPKSSSNKNGSAKKDGEEGNLSGTRSFISYRGWQKPS
jgi:hypothetical protein